MLSAEWAPKWDTGDYLAIRGYYCTPNFQSGVAHAPFIKQGGIIERAGKRARIVAIPKGDESYVKACDGRIRARFVLTVPTGTPPAKGWPLVVYAHGTTGDAASVLGTFARAAARAGMAAVSTDQPLHGSLDPLGARPGSAADFVYELGPIPIPLPNEGRGGELAFYNALRPPVMRDNLRQAIGDGAVLARLLLSAGKLPVAGKDGGPPPAIDGALGYVAAGHSQGSQSMAALGALDPLARSALLSACGGDFSSGMLAREDAKKVKRVVELVLGLSANELNEFHPFATVMQTMLDPVDPQTFGVLYHETSQKPRSALLISGVGDTMTADTSGARLSRAMGLMALVPYPKPIPGVVSDSSVAGNGPRGLSTLALLQIEPSYSYEPHFVAFREPRAGEVMEQFLTAIAKGEVTPQLGDQQRLLGK
jgi:hypothetical protein